MQEKRNTQLNPARLSLFEHTNTAYLATVETGTTEKDLLNPNFWSHIAPKLRPYDEIRVCCDDGSFYVTLLVVSCDRTWAKVKVKKDGWMNLEDETNVPENSEYEIKWGGPYLKFRVIRKKDGGVLRDKLQTKKEASDWLEGHIGTTGKAAA